MRSAVLAMPYVVVALAPLVRFGIVICGPLTGCASTSTAGACARWRTVTRELSAGSALRSLANADSVGDPAALRCATIVTSSPRPTVSVRPSTCEPLSSTPKLYVPGGTTSWLRTSR